MKSYFLDTSALLKRYLKEVGSDVVDAVFEEYATRSVSSLGLLETFSNLQRLRVVDGLLTEDHLRSLQAEVLWDVASGKVVVVNAGPDEVEAGIQLLSEHYLTAVDGLQIATAQSLGPEVVFVSSDVNLNRTAERQGLTVLDPTSVSLD